MSTRIKKMILSIFGFYFLIVVVAPKLLFETDNCLALKNFDLGFFRASFFICFRTLLWDHLYLRVCESESGRLKESVKERKKEIKEDYMNVCVFDFNKCLFEDERVCLCVCVSMCVCVCVCVASKRQHMVDWVLSYALE